MAKFRRLAVFGTATFLLGLLHGALGDRFRSDPALNGRYAASPSAMPLKGWLAIAKRAWSETLDDRLFTIAGAVAFFALLAFVPGLSVLISVVGLFADPLMMVEQLNPILAVLPDAVSQLIGEQAARLAAEPAGSLSITLIVSLLVAGWSASAAIKALFEALNIIYEEREKRSFIVFNLASLAVTVGAVILLASILFLAAILPKLLAFLPFASSIDTIVTIFRWPILVLFMVGGLAALYRIGPSRAPARMVWVLPGALIAAICWAASSAVFSWYVSSLGNYAATYGSLAAVVIFMTWLWLSASIVLMGAELNAELEHQTVEDTTTGAARPMGTRGATVADSVAPNS